MCVEVTKSSILGDNVKLVFKVGSSNLHYCSNCQQIFFTWSPKLDVYIFSFFYLSGTRKRLCVSVFVFRFSFHYFLKRLSFHVY